MIPQGQQGATYQCAAFIDVGSTVYPRLTLCRARYVEGATYPPPVDIPKCAACLAASKVPQ